MFFSFYSADSGSYMQIWPILKKKNFWCCIPMIYACKTLKPGFFWYAVDTNLLRLESTNLEKNSQTPDAFWWGAKPHTKWKFNLFFFQKCLNIFIPKKKSIFFFLSKVFKFTWLKNAELAESKEKSDFYFSSYGQFWSFWWRHHPNFRWNFHDNSKNKNLRTFL